MLAKQMQIVTGVNKLAPVRPQNVERQSLEAVEEEGGEEEEKGGKILHSARLPSAGLAKLQSASV